MRIEIADSIAGLEPYADAWNRLAYESPQGVPMLSHAWVASFLEHLLGTGDPWSCLFAFDGNELVGVLPVIGPSRGILQGGCFTAPDDSDVRVGDILSAGGREAEVVPALLGRLMSDPDFGRLRLGKLFPESPALRLAEYMPAVRSFAEPDGYGSYFRVKGTFDAFLAALNGGFRGKIMRAGRKLDGLPGAETEFLSGDAAGEEPMRAFFELENSGWKGREGSSILASGRHTAFFTALTLRLARAGMLEWHFIKARGEVIAGSMIVRTRRKLTGWKLAYDEECGSLSPGVVLVLRSLRRAYEGGGIDEFDMVSDYPWYSHLRAERRPYVRLVVSSPRMVPRMCAAVGVMARTATKAARRQVKESPVLMPLIERARGMVAGLL